MKIISYFFWLSCEISFYRYEALYTKILPESILGEAFLEKYADHNDSVTVIDPKCTYGVRAPAKHPIYENFRVKVSDTGSYDLFEHSEIWNIWSKFIEVINRYIS